VLPPAGVAACGWGPVLWRPVCIVCSTAGRAAALRCAAEELLPPVMASVAGAAGGGFCHRHVGLPVCRGIPGVLVSDLRQKEIPSWNL
jgi:hypothetical protein